MENMKENHIKLKLLKNLYIIKLVNLYIEEDK